MVNMKMRFVVSSALIFGLITGCGTTGTSTNGGSAEVKVEDRQQEEVETNFHTSIETKEENDIQIVNYKVKNISGEKQTLTFSSGLQVDYIVYDKEGNKVKQYSDEILSTQAIEEVNLENDDEIQQEFMISDLEIGEYVIEVFLTAKEDQAKVLMDLIVENTSKEFQGQTETITLSKSVLEVDEALLSVFNKFKESKNSNDLKGLEPFEIFQLYMYTQAGEDFETLYYFHNIEAVRVDKYKEEQTTSSAIEHNRTFMRNLNEVREFQIVITAEERVFIGFKLPNVSETLEFKMEKGEDGVWHALWVPFQ